MAARTFCRAESLLPQNCENTVVWGGVLLTSATSFLTPAASTSVSPCHTVIVVWPFLLPPAGDGPCEPPVLAPPLLPPLVLLPPQAARTSVRAMRGRRMRRFIVSLPSGLGSP